MINEPITVERIDELLAFLPGFEDPDREYIERWTGGKTAAGDLIWPHPVYAPDVVAFFRLAGQSCWCDYGYQPAEAGAMLADDDLIRSASLEQVKTMLTFCVRGERFSDGHWGAMLREGRIVLLLRRLALLREQLAEGI